MEWVWQRRRIPGPSTLLVTLRLLGSNSLMPIDLLFSQGLEALPTTSFID